MNSHQKRLLWIHGAYGLASTMAGLFLNLYLWRISNDMNVNAIYMIGTFLFGPLAFWVGGKIAKKFDRLFSYQLGIALTAFFYILVVLLQETVATIPFWIGVLSGFSTGMYWLGFFVILYDIVETKDRSAFMGKQMAVLGTVTTTGPAFAGFVITRFDSLIGYTVIFTLATILFITGFILSFKLPRDHYAKRNLRIPLIFRFNRRFFTMKKMWPGWIIWGGCEGLIFFLPMLLIYQELNSEFLVGLTTILLGVIAIVSSLWHSKHNPFEKQHQTVLYTWILYVIAAAPLLFNVNLFSVFVFIIANEICKALLSVSYFGYFLKVVEVLPKRSGLRTEMLVYREWLVNLGRTISVLCFIFFHSVSPNLIFFVLFGTIFLQGILYVIMVNGKSEMNRVDYDKHQAPSIPS
ncbi:MFS transporter [Bacillus sp. PS06]|uniref:MFS transporter n=1 Tax=Bacillus sp. PS06 TaxID=2764176 RepID=UPI0017861A62|nr:MFS transporter [Bacillus sp. PS06]MBD8068674.1 MFS transporter [Bacillus sp. PS06]